MCLSESVEPMDVFNFDISEYRPWEWLHKPAVEIRVVCSGCRGVAGKIHGIPDSERVFLTILLDMLDWMWKNESSYRGARCMGTPFDPYVIPEAGSTPNMGVLLQVMHMETMLGERAAQIARENLSWTRAEPI